MQRDAVAIGEGEEACHIGRAIVVPVIIGVLGVAGQADRGLQVGIVEDALMRQSGLLDEGAQPIEHPPLLVQARERQHQHVRRPAEAEHLQLPRDARPGSAPRPRRDVDGSGGRRPRRRGGAARGAGGGAAVSQPPPGSKHDHSADTATSPVQARRRRLCHDGGGLLLHRHRHLCGARNGARRASLRPVGCDGHGWPHIVIPVAVARFTFQRLTG